MQNLDSVTFPLTGASLIEASAGTGKTYTIVNLYLRLLLGHGCRAHSVEEILVVTFTKAATAELRERIRQRLHKVYLEIYRNESDDEVVKAIIHDAKEPALLLNRLRLAIRQMDEASIYTIHSFCQRMLAQHAFESGAIYEQSVILDETQWLRLATNDYWRRYIVPLSFDVTQLVLDKFKHPEALLGKIRPLLNRPVNNYTQSSLSTAVEACERYIALVKRFKQWWREENVATTLQQAGLKKSTKLGKEKIYQAIADFCQSDAVLPVFDDKDGWMVLSAEKVDAAQGKVPKCLAHLDLTIIDRLHDALAEASSQLTSGIAAHALEHVADILSQHKKMLGLLAPDDLLRHLQQALCADKGDSLLEAIRSSYPAAMIDEFQDTDAVQFEIFERLYMAPQKHQAQLELTLCMVMIGDPKQAIYGFRGADIFTYLKAKKRLDATRLFTMDTNWRSQPDVVEAVNGLFSRSEGAFLFDDAIPFLPVKAERKPVSLTRKLQSIAPCSFHHFLSDNELPVAWQRASQIMATRFASHIADIISGSMLCDEQPVKAGDCCVLVRDRLEAQLMRQALKKQGVESVFLIKRSVFSTQMATDLYLLLKAIANPTDERALRAALCTELFAFTTAELETLFADEYGWQKLVEDCFQWQQSWRRYGVMLAVSSVCQRFEIYPKLMRRYDDGNRRITDLRHLTEVLQEQHAQAPVMSQLLHWFGEHIQAPDDENEIQQLRLESDQQLVQIITMHAAKGLEFPFVFIPFGGRMREASEAVYHDDKDRLWVDFSQQQRHLAMADFERKAEDIRLFYVAITRAVNYCAVGIWNAAHNKRKKQSVFFNSALGSLLSGNTSETDKVDALLQNRLTELSNQFAVSYQPFDAANVVEQNQTPPPMAQSAEGLPLRAATLSKPVPDDWRISSYSSISRFQEHVHADLPGRDEGFDLQTAPPEPDEELSRFTFIRGAQAGSFLHGVLEQLSFDNTANIDQLISQQGQWYGIEQTWYPVVRAWLLDVLNTSLAADTKAMQLSALGQADRVAEMEFFMPLNRVRVAAFNQIINQYSDSAPRQYHFDKLNGMLKGFIDLTFKFEEKYYVADYKSNYLGSHPHDYQTRQLETAMQEHDYKLQAILYVLALHRFLRRRLPDYVYDQHVGGACYLFLRGMCRDMPGNGVCFIKPPLAQIDALDRLFSDQSEPAADSLEEQITLW